MDDRGPVRIGSRFHAETEGRPDDVYEAQTGSEPVFVGSRDEANVYMERRRAAGESFVVPGAIIAAGAILVIVGLLAGRMTKRTE